MTTNPSRAGAYALSPTNQTGSRGGGVSSTPSPLDRMSSKLGRKQSMIGNSTSSFKFSAALDAAENEAIDDHDNIEELRLSTKRFMTRSTFGRWYENIMLVISVLSCLEYIWETYLNVSEINDRIQLQYLSIIELIVAIIFNIDWLLNFFMADHKLLFMTSFFSMVDLFSVIPIYTTFNRNLPDVSRINTFKEIALYSMFALNTTRILRALRVRRKFINIEDAIDRYIAEISLYIIVMILFFAAAIQFIEFEYQDHDFHTWIWYIWVTISTVGYGDISPVTTQGRMTAMFIIGFSIIVIPKMTNELLEKMALQSIYSRAIYSPKTRTSKHVIICGELISTSLNDFFEELFHEDHENTDLNAVILLPHSPSVEFIFLMRDSQYFLQLTYLEGSALLDNDLKRAKAETSQAIFIMTNKFSAYPDEEDAKSILLNLSIKRYLSYFDIAQKLYCMQLIRPQNRRHLSRHEEGNNTTDLDLIVCLNEIKMGVMAKAVTYPGANTLLMNLISSFSEEPLDDDDEDNIIINEEAARRKSVHISRAWLKEYQRGCDWEIYTTPLSKIFEGAKFSELSLALYEKIGVVLFGLQITENHFGGQTKLFLNPADYIIPSQEKYIIEAFVIAQNKASSDLSFSNSGVREMEAGFTASIHHFNGAVGGHHGHVHRKKPDAPERKFSVFADSGPKKMNGDEYRAKQLAKLQEDADHAEIKEAQTKAAKKKTSKWQSLKRSALLEKKVESFSYQEILSQLEDQHNERNYYLRESPVEIKEVLIRTNVTDEIPFINNHIIIIGKGFKNLLDLIRPLRAKYLGQLRYIVLLSPVEIPPDIWRRIAVFEGVVVVRGSPLEESNLRRAGIFRATQVVVLAEGNTESDREQSNGMEALVDSDAIFSYQCVKRMNPSAHVVVEIVNTSNINYIDTEVNQSQSGDYKFTAQFAAGTLFTTSLLDSIVCQAYYNPSIIKVLNKLLSGVDEIDRVELSNQARDKSNSAAKGNDSSDEEDGDTFNTNSAASPLKRGMSVHGRSTLSNIQGSCLYQMKVPEDLDKTTYGKLYQHLAMQGIIPLGILRGTFANLNIGPKHNRFPYVYTNPQKNVELFKCDRVFVLATKPVQQTGKLDVKDWILNIQMQQSQNKGKPGESPLMRKSKKSIEAVSMESLDITQKKLEARVSKMSSDLNKKLNSILSAIDQNSRSAKQLGPVQEMDDDSSDEGRQNRDTVVPVFKRQGTNESVGSSHSSPRYTSRKQSIDSTAESTRTIVPSSPRSRRSSVGSIDEPDQSNDSPLTLPTSPPTNGVQKHDSKNITIGAFANSYTENTPSTSGKKRHSFSSPLATAITIDQSEAVTNVSPAVGEDGRKAINAESKSRPQSAATEISRDTTDTGFECEDIVQQSPSEAYPPDVVSNKWVSTKSVVSTSDIFNGSDLHQFLDSKSNSGGFSSQPKQYDSEAELKETSPLTTKLKPGNVNVRPQSATAVTQSFPDKANIDRAISMNDCGDDKASTPPGPTVELTQSTTTARIARIRSGTFFHSPQSSPLSRSHKIAPATSDVRGQSK